MSNAQLKTLIIEDSMPTRRMLRARLEALGCFIAGEAENPSVGLKMFREMDPSIVTLDLIMPQVDEMTTEGLFRLIRTEKPETSVIVISSSSKAVSSMPYIAQGAIAYLEKPFVNFDQLRDKLEFLYPELRNRGNSSSAMHR